MNTSLALLVKPLLVLLIATGALVWMHLLAFLVSPHVAPVRNAVLQWYRNERTWKSLMWTIEDTPLYIPRESWGKDKPIYIPKRERNRVRRD
mgnify:FL=1